jgi:hypothetical protein
MKTAYERAISGLIIPSCIHASGTLDTVTTRDARAIIAARSFGRFVYSGSSSDGNDLFFRRFCGDYVDLMMLTADERRASGAQRYERRGFPWPQAERPDPEAIATGSIVDVVRQVLEWPTP